MFRPVDSKVAQLRWGAWLAREQRKLAAIVAADVVGYSRLMEQDENGTLAALRAHRAERIEPALARNGGRVIKLAGDGSLIEFGSAVDAVRAAIEFQQAIAETNAGFAEGARVLFRVGVHLGDVVVDGHDLYGDGVNIAARLEGAAPPGGILISRAVQEAVDGRLKAGLKSRGELSLKNIERPITAYEVEWTPDDWKIETVAAASAPALALPDKPSIAILPFQNMSGDPEQEYFADGMADDITTELSRFKSLFVIARSSSFAYKGKSIDTRQIGRELGVRYVLEGSVRKAGNRVRISGQLVEAESGAHLWAERFDGSLDDVFELQDNVTTKVVSAITHSMNTAEGERARRKPVESLDAYDCYLRGLAALYQYDREGNDRALEFARRAIEIDPRFIPPYGLVIRCLSRSKVQGWVTDEERDQAEIRRLAAHVAIAGRDDAVALGWAGGGLAYVCFELEDGAALIDAALAMNQNLANAWIRRGLVSCFLGDHMAALEQSNRAVRLSPLDPEVHVAQGTLAWSHFFTRRFDEAVTWARQALARDAKYIGAFTVLIAGMALAGKVDEARAMGTRILQLYPQGSIANARRQTPFRRREDNDLMIDGLRLAGIPE